MNIAILGTGMVGQTLAGKLAESGHTVVIGTRSVSETLARTAPGPFGNPPFKAWKEQHPAIALVTYAEAAVRGEILFNATSGGASIAALKAAGEANLAGKILVDVANPLDFSKGMPPSLTVCNTDSLAEQIQRSFPDVRVVKALNTVNALVMINPAAVGGGEHFLPICGNDPSAKSTVTELLKANFGWKTILDLGDITGARATEMMLPIWIRLMGVLKTPMFNFKVVQ